MLVRRSECPCSSFPGVLVPRTVSFGIHWGLLSCAGTGADVEISVIGTGFDHRCPAPDESLVLCGPVLHTVLSPGGPQVYTLPIPDGCIIGRDVFVRVKFVRIIGGPCLALTVAEGPCTPCEQFFTAFSFPDPALKCGEEGGIPFWCEVEADCYGVTTALHGSWGRLKRAYR